jgi:type IV secretion system protein VirB10
MRRQEVMPMRAHHLLLALAVATASCSDRASAPAGPAGGASSAATPAGAAAGAAPAGAGAQDARRPTDRQLAREPEYREVAIPAGTRLPVELTTTVASDASRIEDPVRARLPRALVIDGVEVVPAGSTLVGSVTDVRRPGRVKGRARVAFRFHTIEPAGGGGPVAIRTAPLARTAPATKRRDAAMIGLPAAGGAVIGAIVGGGDAAAKGAVIGGAAGTGAVLATRGKDVRLGPGARLVVRLAAPVTVKVPVKGDE